LSGCGGYTPAESTGLSVAAAGIWLLAGKFGSWQGVYQGTQQLNGNLAASKNLAASREFGS